MGNMLHFGMMGVGDEQLELVAETVGNAGSLAKKPSWKKKLQRYNCVNCIRLDMRVDAGTGLLTRSNISVFQLVKVCRISHLKCSSHISSRFGPHEEKKTKDHITCCNIDPDNLPRVTCCATGRIRDSRPSRPPDITLPLDKNIISCNFLFTTAPHVAHLLVFTLSHVIPSAFLQSRAGRSAFAAHHKPTCYQLATSLALNMYAGNPAMDSSYPHNYGRFEDSHYYNVNGYENYHYSSYASPQPDFFGLMSNPQIPQHEGNQQFHQSTSLEDMMKQLIDNQQQFQQLFEELRQIDFEIPGLKDLETQFIQYNVRLQNMTYEEELCSTQPIFNPDEYVSVDTLKNFEVNEVTQMEDYLRETAEGREVFQIEPEIVITLN
ncbi:hypothetical protein Scep_004155 [Stephania cephalantha]|uniref:Uncharacterized protein n=1 Tax=Stephania cephalantha TaxID=152367 RepID=A0AAP0KRX2_9MAGN